MQDHEEPSGDAARAFEDLRAEVSVLRRAIEALPEEWQANQPPDYTESLGEITQGLSTVVGRLQVIEQHPALRATPSQHQAAILDAGQDLMSRAAGSLPIPPAAPRSPAAIPTPPRVNPQRPAPHRRWFLRGPASPPLPVLPR